MNGSSSTRARDIGIILLASIVSAALTTYASVAVMRSDIRWIRRDLHHESRRIDRTQEALKAIYQSCRERYKHRGEE